MTTFPAPDCLWDLKAELGEGLVWQADEASLYSVDIQGKRVHRIVPATGATTSWDAPMRPTFLVPMQGGGLLCGHEDGLRRFDPATGGFGALHPIEPELRHNRLNDACVDPAGRLWFGSMHDPETEASGSLYRLDRLDPAGSAVPLTMDTGYVVSNGPAIDPGRRRLYHNDTARQLIFAFDLDEAGGLSGKRVFARLQRGYPDGMAVDADGTLWVALYAGGGVQRFTPEGAPDGLVPMPCDNVTKIVFGDADYRTAYVSSAAKGVPEAARAGQPLAGGLFRFRVEVPGAAPFAFRAG